MGAENSIEACKENLEVMMNIPRERLKANLGILQTMAQGKLDTFFSELKLGEDKRKFRIGEVLTQCSEIYIEDTNTAQPLKARAAAVVKSVVGGAISSTIQNVVCRGIDAMFASESFPIAEKKLYTVRIKGIELQRIDIYLFQYDISVSGLIPEKKSVFAYAYAISLVPGHITRSELAAFIAESFGPIDSDDEKGMFQEEMQLIKEQMALYDKLKPLIESQNNSSDEKLSVD